MDTPANRTEQLLQRILQSTAGLSSETPVDDLDANQFESLLEQISNNTAGLLNMPRWLKWTKTFEDLQDASAEKIVTLLEGLPGDTVILFGFCRITEAFTFPQEIQDLSPTLDIKFGVTGDAGNFTSVQIDTSTGPKNSWNNNYTTPALLGGDAQTDFTTTLDIVGGLTLGAMGEETLADLISGEVEFHLLLSRFTN